MSPEIITTLAFLEGVTLSGFISAILGQRFQQQVLSASRKTPEEIYAEWTAGQPDYAGKALQQIHESTDDGHIQILAEKALYTLTFAANVNKDQPIALYLEGNNIRFDIVKEPALGTICIAMARTLHDQSSRPGKRVL